ncbi:MAG: hypothetical protein ACH346_02595 [Chthoniobacterales bacterium]
MKNFALLLVALSLTTIFSGCENLSDDPSAASVSAIPWNKPASWEGTGALGGFGMQGTH